VTEWPAVSAVKSALRDQLQRLTSVLKAVTPEQLARVVDPPHTLRYSITHGLHDEAIHSGEMWLLRKMYAKR
jgi:hypothetical protein